ncbi:MAG: DUF2460 domain-containing protein [Burkholderiaceae bacterium]
MTNAVFPSLPGQSWPRGKTPRFKTDTVMSDSGRQWSVSRMLYPIYKFSIKYDWLSQAHMNQLTAFFKQHRGRGLPFLFEDRDDLQQNDTFTPQVFGTGDATRRTWQLVRAEDGIVEPIGRHNIINSVSINGVATTAYTLDDYGAITFTTAPANGAVLRWEGTFFWRCVFANDSLSFEEFLRQFWTAKTVEFETWKP